MPMEGGCNVRLDEALMLLSIQTNPSPIHEQSLPVSDENSCDICLPDVSSMRNGVGA